MHRVLHLTLVLLMCGGEVLPAAAASKYTFVTIDIPGSTLTQVRGINQRGELSGFYADSSHGVFHGFILPKKALSPVPVDIPGATATRVFDINNRGWFVGNHFQDAEFTMGGGFVNQGGTIPPVEAPGAVFTSAEGINAKGQIVGYYVDANGQHHGFLYSRGVFTTINVPGAVFTECHGLNSRAQIVGTYIDTNGKFHGFVYTRGKYRTIDVPDKDTALFTQARAITDGGRILGYYVANGHQHGYLMTRNKIVTIDVPGATDTFPYDINARGKIAGTYVDEQSRVRGFVATP